MSESSPSVPRVPPLAIRQRRLSSAMRSVPGSTPRQATTDSFGADGGNSRTESPAPSAPRRNPEDRSPRRWLKSPNSAAVPSHLKVCVIADHAADEDDDVVATIHEPQGSPNAGRASNAPSPLLKTRQLSDRSYCVEPHRGTGAAPFHVDYWFDVQPGTDASTEFGEVLDALPYTVADLAAEGFHVAILAASAHSDPLSGVRALIDSDDGDARAMTITMGYVLDLFRNDPVAVDLAAVAISASTGIITDLLAQSTADSVTIDNLTYRPKWGLAGGCRSMAINGIEDIADLPTAGVLSAIAATDDSAVSVFQFRLRRPQAHFAGPDAGDFDVVQHVTFVCLPPGPWNRPGTPGLAIATASGARDAADALTAAFQRPTPSMVTSGSSMTSPVTGAGEDDSAKFMAQQVLQPLLREIFAGPTMAFVLMHAAANDLVADVETQTVLQDLCRLREVTQRVVQPAMSLELEATRAAQQATQAANESAAALVRLFPGIAVLVDRDSLRVVTASAASPTNVKTGEPVALIRLREHSDGSRRSVPVDPEDLPLRVGPSRQDASAAEDDAADTIFLEIPAGSSSETDGTSLVNRHVADTNRLARLITCDVIDADRVLLRFRIPRSSRHSSSTTSPSSPQKSAGGRSTNPPSPALPSKNSMDDFAADAGDKGCRTDDEADTNRAAERVERHQEARRRVVQQKRASASSSNREASCSCVVA